MLNIRAPEPITGFKTLLPIPRKIESARLTLRAYEDADVAALVEAIEESRDVLAPWMPWVDEVKGFDDRLDYVRRMRARFDDPHEDIVYGIFERDTNRFLGGTGVHRINWDLPSFEIGYWLRPSAHGKGVATETSRALTMFAFETFNAARVEIRCDAGNEKSANVPRRLGFMEEARLHSARRSFDGALSDTLIFALTWKNWRDRLR
jgi:ribosomal-protein-serine acetyltransferase